jgi:hypothetical protein
MRRSVESRTAAWIELALLTALLVLLGVAAYKFFCMLDRMGVVWTRGLPVGVLFVGAGFLTYRRIIRGIRRLRSGEGDGNTGRGDSP